jgi:FtsH-binding integral membrane protein
MKIRQGGSRSDLATLLFEKKEFLVLTFANLIFQALITLYALKKYSTEKKNRTVSLFVWIFSFVLVILLVFPMPIWLKFILFCLFSYGWGYSLSSMNVDTMQEALMGAVSIFGVMVTIGFMMIVFGIRLGVKAGLVLFFGLLGLILATLFTSASFTTFGIVLFSFYIIYDTNRILQKNYYGDFITASLDYYLDVLNLFTLMNQD